MTPSDEGQSRRPASGSWLKRNAALASSVVATLVVLIFFFAPVVYSPTPPPTDQLAFLGPQPAYESPSCFLLGFGTGYWQTIPQPGAQVHWSYQAGCPEGTLAPELRTTTLTGNQDYKLITTTVNGTATTIVASINET